MKFLFWYLYFSMLHIVFRLAILLYKNIHRWKRFFPSCSFNIMKFNELSSYDAYRYANVQKISLQLLKHTGGMKSLFCCNGARKKRARKFWRDTKLTYLFLKKISIHFVRFFFQRIIMLTTLQLHKITEIIGYYCDFCYKSRWI